MAVETTGRFVGDLRDPAPAERLLWPDVAKGACIVLVVLWHVIMKQYLQIDWRISTPLPGAWGEVGELLLPLRMPLFFAISGFFAARAVKRPWRTVARSRVAKFFYLYVLWLSVHTLVLSFFPGFATEHAGSVLEFAAQLTITPTNLWYLFALAVYFVIAKVSRRLPFWIMLAAAFALSATASAGLLAVPGDRGGLYQNLVFFLVGIYGTSLVKRVAVEAGWLRLALVGVPYLGVLVAVGHFGLKTAFGLWPVLSLVAIVLGVTAAALVTRWKRPANAIASIGRRTLPIYVIHLPLVAVLDALLHDPLSSLGPAAQLAVAVLDPIVLVAAIVALCLLLQRILPSAWVFDLPVRRTAEPPAPEDLNASAQTMPLYSVRRPQAFSRPRPR
ncbi:acyltransferase family protein [Amycolatopsis sp. NBC_01480]|uniref:acyltransferase family protein n=1 Tax=Amycolatopsis sp. NBC_01480 TaxID=2903562 RepID=UPI002E2D3393|nr:acyltransferase family protein [Amycolatopsis sp. NBC_01480]